MLQLTIFVHNACQRSFVCSTGLKLNYCQCIICASASTEQVSAYLYFMHYTCR